MLGVVCSKVWPVSNFAQQVPTTCNRVCKWTQHLTSDNVASVCKGLKFTSEIYLRSSLFVYIWNDNPHPPCPQKSKDRPHRRRGDKQRLLSYEATILSFFKIRGAQNLIATGSPIIIMVQLRTRRWWFSKAIPIPLDTNTVCKYFTLSWLCFYSSHNTVDIWVCMSTLPSWQPM